MFGDFGKEIVFELIILKLLSEFFFYFTRLLKFLKIDFLSTFIGEMVFHTIFHTFTLFFDDF